MRRGQLWWVELAEAVGSEPAYPRPGVVVSSDRLNESSLRTVVVVALTGNLRRAGRPGNVVVEPEFSGLPRTSVVNVTQLTTVDRESLIEPFGELPAWLLAQVDDGLRLSLELG